MAIKDFKLDLHIHTCLSPCAEQEMTPCKIVKRAAEKGLDAIGIADHNSAENVIAVRKAGEKENLKVFSGIEVASAEEIHFLVFFDKDENLFEFQKIIYENLHGENTPEIFGEQIIIDEEDKVLDINNKLLIGASNLSSQDIVNLAHKLEGVIIASHIDREGFSIIGKLGFIPPEMQLDALEISPRISYKDAVEKLPVGDLPIVTFSDAHKLEDIGKGFTTFLMEELTLEEIRKALSKEEGRGIEVNS